MIRYASQAEVARWLGVSRQVVTNWLARYAEYNEDGEMVSAQFPMPAAVTGDEGAPRHKHYGWLPEQRQAWEEFRRSLRPRRHYAHAADCTCGPPF